MTAEGRVYPEVTLDALAMRYRDATIETCRDRHMHPVAIFRRGPRSYCGLVTTPAHDDEAPFYMPRDYRTRIELRLVDPKISGMKVDPLDLAYVLTCKQPSYVHVLDVRIPGLLNGYLQSRQGILGLDTNIRLYHQDSMKVLDRLTDSLEAWSTRPDTVPRLIDELARQLATLRAIQTGAFTLLRGGFLRTFEHLSPDARECLQHLQALHFEPNRSAQAASARHFASQLRQFAPVGSAHYASGYFGLLDQLNELASRVPDNEMMRCMGQSVPTTPNGLALEWRAPASFGEFVGIGPQLGPREEGDDEFIL